MNDKQKDRLERKKRKITAFLEVAKLNDDDDNKSPVNLTPTPPTQKVKTFNPMDDDELQRMRAELRARQKKALEKPKVYICLDWVALSCEVCPMDMTRVPVDQNTSSDDHKAPALQYYQPIFAVDIQHLILYALEGNSTAYKPRWCKLLRPIKVSQIVLLEIPDVTKQMFLSSQHCLPFIKQQGFDMCTEMISPAMYGSTFLTDVMDIAISRSKLRAPVDRDSQEDEKPAQLTTQDIGYAKVIEINQSIPAHLKMAEILSKNPIVEHVFSRLDLLLNAKLLVLEGFPLPIELDRAQYFVYTHDKYTQVTANSPMFALDGEMCMTCTGQLELTRIAVVNEHLETVYDTLVKPRNRIVNYLTKYSGITKGMLSNVKTRLEDVQAALRALLPSDAILCGQSLYGDLRTIKMFHPYVIDTSVIYNLTGVRQLKPGLKRLSELFLGKFIQDSESGHNPVEDAMATMELVQLKLKEGPTFGDAVLGGAMVPATKAEDTIQSDASKSSNKSSTDSKSSEDEDDDDDDEPPQKKIKSVPQLASQHPTEAPSSGDDDGESDERDADDANIQRKSRENIKGRPDPGSVTNQQKLFFQKLGSGEKKSLFSVAESCKRKVCLIAPECTLQSWRQTPAAETANFVLSESNKSCRRACKSAVQGEDFLIWAQFDTCTEEEEEHMKQVDKWVKKVSKKCKPNTMLIVLLAGKPIPSSHCNAVCLVKIT